MPFLRSLIAQVVRKAASDPRVRDTAKKLYEDEVKPLAKDAWKMAKPEVAGAKDNALKGAARLAVRFKKEFNDSKPGSGPK